ncbi:MAG: hypothetical protein RI897_1495 [Verrucomicrobiota bacterium]
MGGWLEVNGESDLGALGHDIVAEAVGAGAVFVVSVDPAVAGLEGAPVREAPAEVGEGLPGEVGAYAEAADIHAGVEAEVMAEGEVEVGADDGVPPVLGAGGDAGLGEDTGAADFATDIVVAGSGEDFDFIDDAVAEGGFGDPLVEFSADAVF